MKGFTDGRLRKQALPGNAAAAGYGAIRRRILIPLLIAASICPLTAFAKRGVPKPVPPVVLDGVEYRAPHARMGFVEAIDTASGRKLWETRLYHVLIDPLAECDVQDVFIRSLEVEAGTLLVRNEAGKTYRLDLKTGHVNGAIWYLIPLLCVEERACPCSSHYMEKS